MIRLLSQLSTAHCGAWLFLWLSAGIQIQAEDKPESLAKSPNGRFDMRFVSSDEGRHLAIFDLLTSKEHCNVYAPSNAYGKRAFWSPDSLMVATAIFTVRERTECQVFRWHKGRFTEQALPMGTAVLKWHGNEAMECSLPVLHAVKVDDLHFTPDSRQAALRAEVMAQKDVEVTVESTSPDGRFEMARLHGSNPTYYAGVIRDAHNHDLLHVCFGRVGGGVIGWSPDSLCLLFSHGWEGQGAHEPSMLEVVHWNGSSFDRLDLDYCWAEANWDAQGRLNWRPVEKHVLTSNPKRMAFELDK